MRKIVSFEGHPGSPDGASGYRHHPSLPIALSKIVGRTDEIARVRALFDAGDTRLVTLTGPGGIGKTRLALELAAELRNEFAHGAHLVTLASVQDARLAPAAVASALRIKVGGTTTLVDGLAEALHDQHVLIVLDNVEHVVEGVAPWLAELLRRCPRLHVLATSRRPLRIDGERQVPVPPLDLPESLPATTLDSIRASGAVRLFVERARSARAGFELTEENATAVAAICRALDGLPLAIELAAARIVILSPNALMARLSSRLTLLSGNRRDAPPRHQTMRAAIAWSYELLTEPEQRLFRLLSVFSGGFTVAAVEGVCRRWAADVPVLDTLAALVDHSLVKHGARVGDSVRFELLETMRAFGLDRLAAHSEEDAARDAHAACFAEMAADTEAEVLGQSRIASLDQVEVEYDNIWAALGWLIQHERIEAAMDLAGSLWLLRRVPVYTAEARGQLDVLLVDPRARGRTSRRARALLLLGTYASELGDPAAARDALEEAQSIFEELGDALGMSRVLRRMAVTLSNTGSIEPAIAALRQRLDLTPRDGHEWEIASTLDYLGGLLLYQNDHVATQECLTEALRLYRAIDDRFGIASVLSTQGMLSAREGDAERARRCYRECIELSTEFDYDYHLTIAQLGLADVDLRGGEVEAAAAGLVDALAASQQTGWLHGAGVARAGLGVVEMRRGNLGLAIEQERGSLADFRRLGLRFGLQHGAALSFDALACIALIAGDGEAAARFLGMADGLHERIGVARPTGEPDFVGRTEIDRIRAGLASPRLHDVWEAGRIAAEGEIVAAAMEYQLPAGVAGAGVAVPEAARSLTARELEVLRLIAAGKSNQQIAETLFVSTRTAAGHVGNLLQKLGLKSRTGVVAFAVRNGLA